MGVNTYTKFATCPLNIFIHALFSKEGGGDCKKDKSSSEAKTCLHVLFTA